MELQEEAAQMAGFLARPNEFGRVDGRVLLVELDQLNFGMDVGPAQIKLLVLPKQPGF
jgi:hypothetical protein